ncbi:hypothetical protein [Caballeronia insecticola]|uniref:hypothetical protein n=1 Tax=Caballeronia insecticola TaxID=758793 RepID=UPI0011844099|nr:hypothetical protein [Caballeronia insecticola]
MQQIHDVPLEEKVESFSLVKRNSCFKQFLFEQRIVIGTSAVNVARAPAQQRVRGKRTSREHAKESNMNAIAHVDMFRNRTVQSFGTRARNCTEQKRSIG